MRKVKPAHRISKVAFPIKNIEPLVKLVQSSGWDDGSNISLGDEDDDDDDIDMKLAPCSMRY